MGFAASARRSTWESMGEREVSRRVSGRAAT
jgi:hypothetical protein